MDYGGGTIDTIAFIVNSLNPSLQFEELLPGKGATISSTSIDWHMLLWLQRLCPSGFKNLSESEKSPLSPLMKAFEKIKHQFEASTPLNQKYHINCPMSSESSSENCSSIDHKIIFTR